MNRLLPLVLGLGVAVGSGGCGCSRNDATPVPTVPTGRNEPAPAGPPVFEDVTKQTGIDFSYRNGEEVQPPHLSILESLGGGLAVIDFDGDGRLDLFFPGGGYFGGAGNKQILGHPCRLYRNAGDWKFTDVTKAAGLDALAGGQQWFYTHGATVGDYDRDGWPDLLVTGWRRVALFHNEPDGKGGRRFVDVSAAAGLADGILWATSAAFADFDGDGLPDLWVCQYVDWSFDNHPDCNYDGKTPDVCPPKKFGGLMSKVFRNAGGGKFVDVSAAAGVVAPGKGENGASKSLGILVVDTNGDSKPDVYIANDTVPNFLYVNQSTPGTIKFAETGMLAGVALDGSGSSNGSMGLDAGDPEGTGKPVLFVTNYENEFHAFYRNLSTPTNNAFVFATEAVGLGVIGQKYVGWGTGFFDFDLDGYEDLYFVAGHAIRYPTGATRRQVPVLFRNEGKKFRVVSDRGGPFFQQPHLSRGAVLADLDNDGRIDLVVCNMNESAAVLRNVAPAGNHWLGVELAGKDNTSVVGAKVILEAGGRTQTRFAKSGGSYASSPDRRAVFGLGSADKATKLTVVWPDGSRQEWSDVSPDRYYRAVGGVKDLAPAGQRGG